MLVQGDLQNLIDDKNDEASAFKQARTCKSATVNQQNINLLSINQCMVFFSREIKGESYSESLPSISKV